MLIEVMNRSANSDRNSSKVVDPGRTWQHLTPVSLRNGSTAVVTPATLTNDPPAAGTSGIVPAIIAAALFITFLLALYAVLWKCMVSPPQRKKSKLRVRMHQANTV